MNKIEWIKTPAERGVYLSTDGQWMVSFGLGGLHPDHPRIWKLYQRTGKYVKGEGEILKMTLGSHWTAEAAMKAAEWTEEERDAAYDKEYADTLAALKAKNAAREAAANA